MVCEILGCFGMTCPANALLRQQMITLMSGEIKGDQDMILLCWRRNAEERLAAFCCNLSARRGFSPREFRPDNDP